MEERDAFQQELIATQQELSATQQEREILKCAWSMARSGYLDNEIINVLVQKFSLAEEQVRKILAPISEA